MIEYTVSILTSRQSVTSGSVGFRQQSVGAKAGQIAVRTRALRAGPGLAMVGCWLVAAAIVVTCVAAPAVGLTINLSYSSGTSAPPSFDPGGLQLQALMTAAVDAWEEIIQDEWYLDLSYYWTDLDDVSRTLALELTYNTFMDKPTMASIRFDSQLDGMDRNWYVDATPTDNSEFDLESLFVGDLSAGERDAWYNGDPPDSLEVSYSGPANASAPEAAQSGYDLFSIALHEVGHAVGLNSMVYGNETNDGDFDVPAALAGGAEMAVEVFSAANTAHLAADEALMYPYFGIRTRRLPSATDILAVAAAAQWSTIAMPRPIVLGDMDGSGFVDFDDIAGFVLGLNDPNAYQALFGVAARYRGDLDGDEDLDFDDIPGFVGILAGGSSLSSLERVPEPGTGALLVLGAAGILLVRGGRRPLPRGHLVQPGPKRQALCDGWVAVEKENLERMRVGVILVEPGQLLKCRHVGVAHSRSFERVAVALTLVAPADGVLQWFEQDRQQCQGKHQQRQRLDTQRGIVNRAAVPRQQPVADPEAEQTVEAARDHHLADVMMDMVADFVGKNDFNLVGGELCKQGVAQDHAPGSP